MHKIRIDLKERSYSVLIENDLLKHIGERLSPFKLNRKIALISGEHVSPLYEEIVQKSLEEAGHEVLFFQMPSGEKNKNIDTVQMIYDHLLTMKLDRSSGIVALGGGVIGDTAGFAAATLFRGINLIQIPTTLLSQVDSAVGGKVGINHPRGKNLVGAIYQPKAVIIDPTVLQTLAYRERVSGFAEIVKYGLIRDRILYEFLIKEHKAILNLDDKEAVLSAITRAVEIKAAIISEDEMESNTRMILNFGHSIGHAIENTAGYGVFTHGEAVLVGMVGAVRISHEMGLIDRQLFQDLVDDLKLLPVQPTLQNLDTDSILNAMHHDKKVKDGKLRFILLKNIGETQIRDDVPESLIGETIQWLKEIRFEK